MHVLWDSIIALYTLVGASPSDMDNSQWQYIPAQHLTDMDNLDWFYVDDLDMSANLGLAYSLYFS